MKLQYTTAEGFADILNEVKRRAEALNYSLIIGAHGCGWTYSSDWVKYPYMARPNAGFAQKGNTMQPYRYRQFQRNTVWC